MKNTQNQGSNDFFEAMQNKTTGNTTENNFSKASLLPGENIVATAKWQIAPLIVLLFFVAIICWIVFFSFLDDYTAYFAWLTIFPWALISTILILIVSVAKKFNEFVITNKRVIAYYGFIRRAAFELKTEQVESIIIYQGLFARLFGFGTIQVCGIGASKALIRFVDDPFEFRQHFFDLQYGEKKNTIE